MDAIAQAIRVQTGVHGVIKGSGSRMEDTKGSQQHPLTVLTTLRIQCNRTRKSMQNIQPILIPRNYQVTQFFHNTLPMVLTLAFRTATISALYTLASSSRILTPDCHPRLAPRTAQFGVKYSLCVETNFLPMPVLNPGKRRTCLKESYHEQCEVETVGISWAPWKMYLGTLERRRCSWEYIGSWGMPLDRANVRENLQDGTTYGGADAGGKDECGHEDDEDIRTRKSTMLEERCR